MTQMMTRLNGIKRVLFVTQDVEEIACEESIWANPNTEWTQFLWLVGDKYILQFEQIHLQFGQIGGERIDVLRE